MSLGPVHAELPIITMKVSGGLGNQLFQYAAARSLSIDKRANLLLDLSFFDRSRHRTFELDKFKTSGQFLRPKSGPRWIRTLRDMGRRALRLGSAEYFEPHYHYDPDLLKTDAPCVLNGYFQSPRYFEHHADIIRRELQPPVATDAESHRLARILEDPHSVSLHVRRGDYVTNAKARQMFAECGVDYYGKALNMVPGTGPVVVFSDDVSWARQHLAGGRNLIFAGEESVRSGLADLWLMTKAMHHIIANSTFSWWGAWLAERQNGITIAPDRWFCESREKSADLLPESWIRL